MKSVKRTLTFALALILAACSIVFAAGSVTIVSPAENSVVAADSLLISVKVENKKTVNVAVYEEVESVTTGKGKDAKTTLAAIETKNFKEDTLKNFSTVMVSGAAVTTYKTTSSAAGGKVVENVKEYSERTILKPEKFQATATVGFFTKQLADVKPGVYRVVVETLDSKGKVTDTVSSYVAVTVKPAEKDNVLETQQTGVIKAVTTVLKSIFK